MFEDYQICPYTGLRSFTEEESLYFKGREEHIEQATEQLQRNKFLMLTGASGDGKSSLVYAGIIPNARAGFLKSKYTQWCVADFRPERTPFKNLCKSLARQLEINNPATVESELHHGFSALVDLYRNSRRSIDTDSLAWRNADDTERARLKREASNLLILVDQFEEFFTNPENYHRGVPSRDANLVLNLLLETARISLEEDLPIYVVFTMRSDYIGQCAAFRGLPEYIGFSQFFVPRLNRAQLQQVIEEPATLSGNKITRRLTERLILDLTEGVDQLPILQHALNQIWLAANNGSEEMDLIHYAMVGGMSVNELPDDQVSRFKQWFASLPPEIKDCYHEPDLQNVLDTHTNKLYEQASLYYQTKTGKPISEADAKAIIKTAFTCLTKIDQSRAVRNRMTLQEIANILGRPGLDARVVADVLNIFREPGNTFIRPFITDEPESQNLPPDQVLDITHESLIRNWAYLEQWAKEEFDNYTVSLDFGQQLNRWVKSSKSSAFLFSIGPLTYFENWYDQVRPNAYWIARYLPEDITPDKKLKKAKQILSNSQELLKKSARKHVVTRTIMRYGPRRIAVVLGILTILVLSSFVVRDYLRQQNGYVLQDIRKQVLQLLNSPKVDLFVRAELASEAIQDNLISVKDISANASNGVLRINTLSSIAALLVYQGRREPNGEIIKSISLLDSLFHAYSLQEGNPVDNEKILSELVYYNHAIELAWLYNPSDEIKTLRQRSASLSADYANFFFASQPESFHDMNRLHRVFEHAINHNALKAEDVHNLISKLSPWEPEAKTDWIRDRYQRDKVAVRSFFDYGFKFNGLYQQLAYLYASQGKVEKVLQCVDTLLQYNQSYLQNDFTLMLDNATNIAGVLYTSGNKDMVDTFVAGYSKRKGISVTEFYDRLLSRSVSSIEITNNLDPLQGGYSNGNLQYGSIEQSKFFFNRYRDAIKREYRSKDEINFYLALTYKNEGLLRALKHELASQETTDSDSLYKESIRLYQQVSSSFLAKPERTIGILLVDVLLMPKSYQFLYPDYKTTYHPFEPRATHAFYTNPSFMKYLAKNGLVDKLYAGPNNLQAIEHWLRSYHSVSVNIPFFVRKLIAYNDLVLFEEAFSTLREAASIDLNVLYLHLGEGAFAQDNKQHFLKWYRKLRPELIFNTVNITAGPRAFRSYAEIVTGLIHYNMQDSAYLLVQRFKNPVNRSSIYAFASYQLLRRSLGVHHVKGTLDSAQKEITRIENLATGQPNRILIAYALVLQADKSKLDEAYRVIKNLQGKSFTIQIICRSLALRGSLFEAIQNVPDNVSDSDRANMLRFILEGYEGERVRPEWEEYSNSYFWYQLNPINYINESA